MKPVIPARIDVPFTVIGWNYIHRPCEFVGLRLERSHTAANGPVWIGVKK